MKTKNNSNQATDQQPTQQVLPLVKIGRLDTVAGWRKEIGRVYRAMRRRELPHEDGTRLTYVANVAAQLVRVEQELERLNEIQRRLEAAEQQPPAQLSYDADTLAKVES